MAIKIMLVFVLINAVWGDNTITREDSVIQALLTPCRTVLANEIQEIVNSSKKAEEEFLAANETCQKSLVTLIDSCRKCVKEQCFKRAQVLNCTVVADFNKTFDEGIEKLGEKIKYFFTVAIPKVFTEDLTKFFGQDLPHFFQNDFVDFFKKTIPEFFTTDMTNFFTNVVPNFFNNDVKNFFNNDVKNFFTVNVTNYGKSVKKFFEEEVPKAFEDVKKKVSNFFSGRRRKREATSEPSSCEDFNEKNKVLSSCSYYLQNCTECLPSLEEREKTCPDLAKAHNKMKEYSWIIKGAMSNGTIIEINSVSTASDTIKDNTYQNPDISLTLFGKELKFQLKENVIISDKEKTCKAIAKVAIDMYKSNLTDSTTENQ